MKKLLLISTILALIPICSSAASLTPSVMEIAAEKGQTIEKSFTVINARVTEQTYFLGTMKFEPGEEGGTPKFIPFEEDHSGLTEWISLPFSEFKIPANSKGEIPFSISVPSYVVSGGYYAAITVSNAPSEVVETNGATVEAKTAMLILLTVKGNNTEKLEVLDLTAEQGGLMFDLGNTFQYRLQNQGNVHELPTGKLILKDIFGRKLTEIDANQSQGRVLPSSTRTFEIKLPKMSAFAIGPVTAQINLVYGQANQTLSANLVFWYVPWQSLVCLVVLIIVLYWLLKNSRKQQ